MFCEKMFRDFLLILIFEGVLILGKYQDEHFPVCIVVDTNTTSPECLDTFFRYWGSNFPNGTTDETSHEWVKFLGLVYNYNDKDFSQCVIEEQTEAQFLNGLEADYVFWSQNGFTTCTTIQVSRFNKWFDQLCEENCADDNNCRNYPLLLNEHLWNNCTWDSTNDRPAYDITVP